MHRAGSGQGIDQRIGVHIRAFKAETCHTEIVANGVEPARDLRRTRRGGAGCQPEGKGADICQRREVDPQRADIIARDLSKPDAQIDLVRTTIERAVERGGGRVGQ